MSTDKVEPNFLESALYYAKIGYDVLPCEPGGKRPCSRLVHHGVKDATCDPETIRRWWTEVPSANIGIATGRSGILVIDLDRKQNKDGLNDIQAIANERDCDVQQVAQTPSGGEHWYYRQPEKRTFKASTGLGDSKGIDIRSQDTYVLAPPSVIGDQNGAKKAYQWGCGATPWDAANKYTMCDLKPITELTYPPEWLVEWLGLQNLIGGLPSGVGGSIESLPATLSTSDIMSRVYRYLEKAEEAIQGQGGEKTTFRVLCAVFHGFDLTEPQLRQAFEFYNRKCTPAWSGSEAEHKISEVLKSTPSTGKQRGHLQAERRYERYDDFGDKAYPECFYSNSAKNQTNDRTNDMSSDSPGMLAQDIEGKVCRSFPLLSFAEIKEERIEWLIPNFIPLKMLTGFVGLPDVGKSWLLCDIAARLSRGNGIPYKGGCRDKPCETLIISAEDSPGMVRERLRYAEADLSKIFVLGVKNDSGCQLEHFNLEMHRILDQTLQEHPAIQLVIIDPISSYLGDANENRNDEVRRLLGYLKNVAEQRNIAVVFVTHNRKGSAGTAKDLAIDKVIGSRAISAVPRMLWLIGLASEDRASDRHVALIKGNILSEEDRGGFTYQIVDKRVKYTGVSTQTANELSAATAIHRSDGDEGTRGPRRSEEREQCTALIRKELEKHGGILRKGRFSDCSPPHTLGRFAVDNGYTKNIYQLACKDLELVTWRDEHDYSWLCLPEAVNDDGVPILRPETTTLSECAQILQSEMGNRDGRMPLGKFSANSELGTIGRLCNDHQFNRFAFKKAKKELSLTLEYDDGGNTYYSIPKVKDSVPVGGL